MKQGKYGLLVGLLILLAILVVNDTGIAGEMQELAINGRRDLQIVVEGAKIEFVENSDRIYLSEELIVKNEPDSLYITSPRVKGLTGFFNLVKVNQSAKKIIIGTAGGFSRVEINSGGVAIRGTLQAETIEIKAAGIDIQANLTAEKLRIAGAGLNLRGKIKTEELVIESAGMDIDIAVEDTRQLALSGAGFSVKIKYLDTWAGRRQVKATAVGGDLSLLVPRDNGKQAVGELDVDTSGFITVKVDYY